MRSYEKVRLKYSIVACATLLASACASDEPVRGDEPANIAAQAAASPDAATPTGACRTFDGAYDAIQKLVFEARGCTASACHGTAKVGGLDLRAGASYEQLVDVPSTNSHHARVQPGTATDSFLYQKLQAATHPGSVQVAGSPMPVGTAALSEKELEAVALWIQKGAPKTGSVADKTKNVDVGSLLDACLPPAKPVKTKPLDPPKADEGLQFVLPHYTLKGNSEIEQCTPFAYDLSDQVPAQYKDEKRNVIFVNGSHVRQDPQSHHLVLWNPRKLLTEVPNDGTWTCSGGEHHGAKCDPGQGSKDCGGGMCAGKSVPGTLCGLEATGGIDLTALADPAKRAELMKDPAIQKALADLLKNGGGIGAMPGQVANTQSPQEYLPPMEGVYYEIPLRGVLWFNSHAFNLDEQDTVLEARVNYLYAKKLEREMRPVNVIDNNNIAHGQPPFTRKTYCGKHVVPEGYSLAIMTGHTHRRGEHFWVNDASGAKIYETFTYNDPLYKRFEPWRVFDQADPVQRTLEYCATYSNGLKKNGQPDTDLVTRASRMPDRTGCKPVACTAGKVTSACTVDSDCDSSPGRGDGECDACPITAGQTTENEMFVLMPWYILPAKP
ncbi:MAG: hypothetical protein ABW252_04565 [Polyangiales bacterium]